MQIRKSIILVPGFCLSALFLGCQSFMGIGGDDSSKNSAKVSGGGEQVTPPENVPVEHPTTEPTTDPDPAAEPHNCFDAEQIYNAAVIATRGTGPEFEAALKAYHQACPSAGGSGEVTDPEPDPDEGGVVTDPDPDADEGGVVTDPTPEPHEGGVITDPTPEPHEGGVVTEPHPDPEAPEAPACTEASKRMESIHIAEGDGPAFDAALAAVHEACGF